MLVHDRPGIHRNYGFTDAERAAKALQGIVGKRLTYRRISSWA